MRGKGYLSKLFYSIWHSVIVSNFIVKSLGPQKLALPTCLSLVLPIFRTIVSINTLSFIDNIPTMGSMGFIPFLNVVFRVYGDSKIKLKSRL